MKRDISVLLLYPPNQNPPGTVCKPNGSLAYPNLGGALREHGIPVAVYDACVGAGTDDLNAIFSSPALLQSGLLRTGVGDERILEVVADHDVIGITSIFTDQESMVLHCSRIIKQAFPDKILISGGVNARSRHPKFFDAGFDIVCLSESERTLVQIVDAIRESWKPDFSRISGIIYRDHDHHAIRTSPTRSTDVVQNLDDLPMPAWDLLPNQRYWTLARPHSGVYEPGAELRYASMMTSLGCPFHCAYCHIAGEEEGSLSGPIRSFRVKSDERVLAELDTLKALGVTDVFIEDDSLLGQKKRGLRLLEKIQAADMTICDLNGINIIHLLKRWKPDYEVLEALASAGFTQINLPFETGSLRIMRKYASNKLNVEQADLVGLIEAMKSFGFKLYGNYMIGYPDESPEEVDATIALAKKHVSCGLDAANFFLVVPMPGTPLFDMAIDGGHLDPDFDPDRMSIYHATMQNTTVPPAELMRIRDAAWNEVNSNAWKSAKKSWAVMPSTSS